MNTALGLFSTNLPQTLQTIANNDLATQDIEDDLLNAPQKGQDRLDAFLKERLMPSKERCELQGQTDTEQVFDFFLSV